VIECFRSKSLLQFTVVPRFKLENFLELRSDVCVHVQDDVIIVNLEVPKKFVNSSGLRSLVEHHNPVSNKLSVFLSFLVYHMDQNSRMWFKFSSAGFNVVKLESGTTFWLNCHLNGCILVRWSQFTAVHDCEGVLMWSLVFQVVKCCQVVIGMLLNLDAAWL
jgi:hypothetical protein